MCRETREKYRRKFAILLFWLTLGLTAVYYHLKTRYLYDHTFTIVTSVTTFHLLQGEIFSCLRPGNVQKYSHPGGAPETKPYFLGFIKKRCNHVVMTMTHKSDS